MWYVRRSALLGLYSDSEAKGISRLLPGNAGTATAAIKERTCTSLSLALPSSRVRALEMETVAVMAVVWESVEVGVGAGVGLDRLRVCRPMVSDIEVGRCSGCPDYIAPCIAHTPSSS